jgi:hypothetical protein
MHECFTVKKVKWVKCDRVGRHFKAEHERVINMYSRVSFYDGVTFSNVWS